MSSNAIGVDIGGTKVAAGLVNAEGQVLRRAEFPMYVAGSAQQALECVHSAIRAVMNGSSECVSAIGVASPGPLALPEGIVVSSPNLPCWRNFRLGDAIRTEYGITTIVDNDANAAGLAEALWGAGAEYDSVFCVTIGTGIGTAFVLHKQLYYGHTAVAPEGGHMTIDINAPCHCECGKRGCLEGMASGPSMARRARERISAAKSYNTALWGTDLAEINPRLIEAAWRAGDPIATGLLRETADLYAVWLGNVIDLIEPAAIVIGGGLSGLFSEWFDTIRKQLPKCSIIPGAGQIPILRAKFGADAGIVGAAALCQAEKGRGCWGPKRTAEAP